MKKNIFVSGATGAQGSNIAKLFIENGDAVRTLSSLKNNSTTIENLKIIKGGFEDKAALSESLDKVDAAVFTFPMIFNIDKAKEYTENFIDIAEEKEVSLIVFNTAFDLPKDKTGLLAIDLKIEINALFNQSKLNVITLIPDVYIDNIAAPWSIPVIMQNGVLPYPVQSGKKIPWISHKDLAKYVMSAVNKPELAGQTLPIGGQLITGEEIANAIATHIDQPVQFVSVTPNDFEQQLLPAFGELAAKEISNLYRYISNHEDRLLSKSFVETSMKLDVEPQSLEDWVKSVHWKNN